MRNRTFIVLFCGCIILLVSNLCGPAQIFAQGKYCGIEAIAALAAFYKRPFDVNKFITPEFVSDLGGSTVEDLKRACVVLGLSAKDVRLSTQLLTESKYPLILHVTSRNQYLAANHWLLYLGSKGNTAVVVERGKMAQIPLGLLTARWDGIAICVTPTREDGNLAYSAYFYKNLNTWSSALFLVFGLMLVLRKSTRPLLVVFTNAIVLCALIQISDYCGVFHNYKHVQYIENKLIQSRFESVELGEFRSLIKAGNVNIIDARTKHSYGLGSVPAAHNIPPYLEYSEIQSIVANLDREKTTIVFCESRTCHFANIVAIDLLAEGFADIRLFRGGWEEWVSKYE